MTSRSQYVHGAGNKPSEPDIKRAWDEDLFQRDMGDRTRMVYYADLLHDSPAAIPADASSASGALGALVSDAFAGTALMRAQAHAKRSASWPQTGRSSPSP